RGENAVVHREELLQIARLLEVPADVENLGQVGVEADARRALLALRSGRAGISRLGLQALEPGLQGGGAREDAAAFAIVDSGTEVGEVIGQRGVGIGIE